MLPGTGPRASPALRPPASPAAPDRVAALRRLRDGPDLELDRARAARAPQRPCLAAGRAPQYVVAAVAVVVADARRRICCHLRRGRPLDLRDLRACLSDQPPHSLAAGPRRPPQRVVGPVAVEVPDLEPGQEPARPVHPRPPA